MNKIGQWSGSVKFSCASCGVFKVDLQTIHEILEVPAAPPSEGRCGAEAIGGIIIIAWCHHRTELSRYGCLNCAFPSLDLSGFLSRIRLLLNFVGLQHLFLG